MNAKLESRSELRAANSEPHADAVVREREMRESEALREKQTQLAESQMRLAIELAATQRLQEISTQLIGEDDPNAHYEKILDAAVEIMRAQYASIQLLRPERGDGGELWLLGHRGFSPEAVKTWEWVALNSMTSCGMARRTGERAVITNIEACDWMAGSDDQSEYVKAGVHAAQSTPLFSRAGQMLGMLSTHWSRPHQPSERDLRLLDVLARQAADLIERSQVEETLRRSEERYRTLFDSMDECYCVIEMIFDEEGKPVDYLFLEANAAFEKQTGWQDIVGTRMRELAPDHEQYWFDIFGKVAVTGEPIRFEQRTSVIDERWFSLYAFRLGPPDDRRIAVLFTDITEQRRAEAGLIDLNDRIEQQSRIFETTLSSITDFAYTFDREGRFTYVNKALTDLWGLKLEDATGKNFYELNYPDDLAERLQRQILEVFETGKLLIDETPYTSPSGTGGYYEYIFNPVFADDGTVEIVAGSTRDITDRKRIERNLAFISEISLDLTRLSNAQEIMEAVGTKLGSYLRVATCVFSEVDEQRDEVTVNYTWNDSSVPSLRRTFRFEDYLTAEFRRANRAGETTVVRDTQTDPRTDAAAYAALKVGSFVTVPFHRNGEWKYYLAVTDSAMRDWQEDEIELFREISNRIFPRLERARAEEALRENEERFRLALSTGVVTVYEQDLDLRYKWVYPESPYRPDVVGKTDEELSPSSEMLTQIKRRVIETGEAVREEVSATVKGEQYWYDLLVEPRRDADGNITGVGGTALDITARRELQAAHRESEERFRGLMEQAPLSIQLFDPEGRTIRVNRAWEELWGATFEQVIEYNVLADPQLEAQGITTYLRRAFAGEAVELPAIQYDPNETIPGASSRDDPRRWVSAVAYPLKAADGQIREVALVHQDITERKIAEGKLRESEERFGKAFNSSPLAVSITSLKTGRLVEVNQSFVDLTGFSREEAVGHTSAELGLWINEANREVELKRVAEAGNLRDVEYRFRMRDGREVVGLLSAELFDLNGEPCSLAVVQDITERKAAEEARRESEEKFRILSETAPALIWFDDPDGNCRYTNQYSLTFTGKSSDSLDGKGWQMIFHPDDAEDYMEDFEAAQRSRRPFYHRARALRHDGEWRWIESFGRPLYGADGAYLGHVGISTDITTSVEAEEVLARYRVDLEDLVLTRTAELETANNYLKDENARRLETERERVRLLRQIVTTQEDERRRIARDLHDELGQQLTALRLKLETAKDECDDVTLRGEIPEIQAIAERLDREVSFLARELRPAALEETSLDQALAAYIKEWARVSSIMAEFHEDGISGTRLAPELESNLYRIAQEALNNVRKHSLAKNVSVLLKKRRGEITLIVEDDGIAFDPEARPSRKKGLGLVGMHERAALLGGTIEVESAAGFGTTIYARIPDVNTLAEEN